MYQFELPEIESRGKFSKTKWWKRDSFYRVAYLRIKENVDVEEGLEMIGQPVVMFGSKITTNSKRLLLIKNKGQECSCCGAKLSHFHIERQRGDGVGCFILSPYATTSEGKEVLLTWDHIIPKAIGGTDHGDNSQVMCMRCNNEKGCSIDSFMFQIIERTPHLISAKRMKKALNRNSKSVEIVRAINTISRLIKKERK